MDVELGFVNIESIIPNLTKTALMMKHETFNVFETECGIYCNMTMQNNDFLMEPSRREVWNFF